MVKGTHTPVWTVCIWQNIQPSVVWDFRKLPPSGHLWRHITLTTYCSLETSLSHVELLEKHHIQAHFLSLTFFYELLNISGWVDMSSAVISIRVSNFAVKAPITCTPADIYSILAIQERSVYLAWQRIWSWPSPATRAIQHLSIFTESLCPVSPRTASTPSPPHRWTKKAAKSCRSTWWQVRARWGRCEGTTCWCTGSTSGTDTCEARQLQTDKSLTQRTPSSCLLAATARNIYFLICFNLFQCKITSTDGIFI